jgi:hypothetical protein
MPARERGRGEEGTMRVRVRACAMGLGASAESIYSSRMPGLGNEKAG